MTDNTRNKITFVSRDIAICCVYHNILVGCLKFIEAKLLFYMSFDAIAHFLNKFLQIHLLLCFLSASLNYLQTERDSKLCKLLHVMSKQTDH